MYWELKECQPLAEVRNQTLEQIERRWYGI